ncbi:transglutaminase-like cysteine peptidase [Mesorhizobium sp.]|uniref:transglutaminase-like cysteine peptidase n=1 Tax=Mesorhizobium sp. TaxID=1871066 RepID=UPI0025EB4FE2|nr:transglutaminase-like cysteine peptidase [Mesorhizobium sp.]
MARQPCRWGIFVFCKRVPPECTQKTNSPKPLKLIRGLWAKLIDVNNEVNLSVIPKSDQEVWGVEEFWTYPGIYGTCEDCALEKRRRLIDLGFPRQNLLMEIVKQSDGGGHAVLTVTTNFGDILDNRQEKVLLWGETEYPFIKRQSGADSGKWITIDDPRKPAASASDQDHEWSRAASDDEYRICRFARRVSGRSFCLAAAPAPIAGRCSSCS